MKFNKLDTPDRQSWILQWQGMEVNDEGNAREESQAAIKSVQVVGTFDGASLVVEGSNDGGQTWGTMADLQGLPLSFTRPGIKSIGDTALMMRPRVVGGDTSTALSVFAFIKGI